MYGTCVCLCVQVFELNDPGGILIPLDAVSYYSLFTPNALYRCSARGAARHRTDVTYPHQLPTTPTNLAATRCEKQMIFLFFGEHFSCTTVHRYATPT